MSDAAGAMNGKGETVPDGAAKTVPLIWWRRLSQFAVLTILGQWSFYGVFRCPFIVPYVSCQNCPVITCHGRLFTMFWGFWLLLPAAAILFGRAFCGWGCPGGLVNQLLGKVAPFKLRLRNTYAKMASGAIFLGTATALYAWLVWGQPRLAVPIRVGGFFESVALTFEHADLLWVARTLFVLGLTAAGLLAANLWCRFACPTGGALEALKPLSIFRVYKTDDCNDCDKCLKICDMGTRPAEFNCTNCCDCLSVCPQDAIKVGTSRSK